MGFLGLFLMGPLILKRGTISNNDSAKASGCGRRNDIGLIETVSISLKLFMLKKFPNNNDTDLAIL